AIVGFDNQRTAGLPGEVFLLEPRINEMEIVIDEHAIRLLRRGSFNDDEMRLIVAALKITNDLERIGDIAVSLAERFWRATTWWINTGTASSRICCNT
ncbi:MAG: PhoU domain-containing protein, partial [Candidatus Acidiferrum sp.]